MFIPTCKYALNADVYKWSELEGEYIAVAGRQRSQRGGLWDVQSPWWMAYLATCAGVLYHQPNAPHTGPHWGSLAALEPKPGGISGLDFHTVASFSRAKTKRERIPPEFSIFPLNRSINLSPCSVEETFKDIKSPVWEPRRCVFPSTKDKNLCLKCILIGTWT